MSPVARKLKESHDLEPKSRPLSSGFPNKSVTNRTVQPHKMDRDLKFRFRKVVGSYYMYVVNKGADKLRGHRAPDAHLLPPMHNSRISPDAAAQLLGDFGHFSKFNLSFWCPLQLLSVDDY